MNRWNIIVVRTVYKFTFNLHPRHHPSPLANRTYFYFFLLLPFYYFSYRKSAALNRFKLKKKRVSSERIRRNDAAHARARARRANGWLRKKDWKRARKRTGSGRPACLPASTRQIKGELLKRTRNHSATLAFIVVSVDNRAFRLVDRHKGVAVRLAGCPDPYLDRNRGTREREKKKLCR